MAGTGGSGLPKGRSTSANDYGVEGLCGAAPLTGDPPHRYVFAVHALDVESLDVNDEISPAVAGFKPAFPHHRPGRDDPGAIGRADQDGRSPPPGGVVAGQAGQLGQQPGGEVSTFSRP